MQTIQRNIIGSPFHQEPTKAIQQVANSFELHFDYLRLRNEAIIYHELGDHEKAQQSLQEMIDTWGDDASAQVSEIYAAWGNVDETFAALERGFLVRDPGVIYIQSDDQMVELLKGDPRYEAFLRKLNLL